VRKESYLLQYFNHGSSRTVLLDQVLAGTEAAPRVIFYSAAPRSRGEEFFASVGSTTPASETIES
jgi:hypothetical protein